SAGSLPISIASLRLVDGLVSVAPCHGGTCVVDGVTLDAAIDVGGAGVDADVRGLSLRAAAEGLPLAWLDASFRYRGSQSPARVDVRRLTLATESSRMSLHGVVESPDDPRTLSTNADVTIAALAPADIEIFAPQWTLDQVVTGTVRLSGPAK